jgi:hypothetical protein
MEATWRKEGVSMSKQVYNLRVLLAGVMVLLLSALPALAGPPAAPVNVSGAVAANTVSLTWLPGAGGTPPLGYLVEAALSPDGQSLASFLVIQPSIVLNGVPNGVYYVRVRAGNAEGMSVAAPAIIVSVPGGGATCTTHPEPPTNLTATISERVVTLAWDAAASGCPATGFVVQAGSAPGLSDLAIFNVGLVTTLTVSASPGFYFVRVVAVNTTGGSPPSGDLHVVVGATSFDLTGVWSGESNYINAPFTMNLTQRGDSFGGTYRDQKDFGGVAGRITDSQVVIDVNFGDTGFRMNGTIESANRIRGTLFVPVLGGRTFTFEMTR